ncbi:MAG TPA: LysR family transcriptional regulator [Paenalcaligenes sp.]|nr:LysR family transcriptional regulator [Paenalcaligenes sp.]
MIYNIKYRPLKAFLLATETGSFTQAAELLGVTQPSFSALIRDLEQTLGLKLFERTTRRIMLTSEGIDFCDQIRRPIAEIEGAYRSLMDLAAAQRSSIVMGALPSTALTIIPPTLKRLRQTHPALKIRVVEAHNDDLINMLRTSQVEFVLATLLTEVEDFRVTPLVDDVFCAVYPPGHPVAEHQQLYLADLVPYDLILLSKGSSARDLFDRAVADVPATAGLRIDVTHMSSAVSLVHQGLGLAVLPKLALKALNLDGLRYTPLSDRVAHRTINIIRHGRHRLSSAGETLTEGLLEACGMQVPADL